MNLSSHRSRVILSILAIGVPSTFYAGCLSEAAPTDADETSITEATQGLSVRALHDALSVARREDVRSLPLPLRQRLAVLAGRPHTSLPMEAFSEANTKSQLFEYYLLDTTPFQPNVFTSKVPGINDQAVPTATGPNGNLPTVGAVRLVLEPKAGKPTDPNDVRAAIDMFTDISGLFVINNESGWYESWMIRDIRVPQVKTARSDGHAQFGSLTAADATALAAMGTGNNVPSNVFTVDGKAVRFPASTDRFPDVQSNTVGFPVSAGAFNSLQQSDAHAYWEFNLGTNWTFPLYELPGTGGIPGALRPGQAGAPMSLVPGSGPTGITNSFLTHGDNSENPRDADRAEGLAAQRETRNRFIPSGLADEILRDVFMRTASFEPGVGMPQRLFDAYATEVAKVDANKDGVVSFVEADVEGTSDGASNARLYLPATAFNRFAVTREINDGLLAPRFAPSQRAYVLGGTLTAVSPSVPASFSRDADNR